MPDRGQMYPKGDFGIVLICYEIRTSWGVVFDLHLLIWFLLTLKVGAFMHRKKLHPGLALRNFDKNALKRMKTGITY